MGHLEVAPGAQLGLGAPRMGNGSNGSFPRGFQAGVEQWEPEQNENRQADVRTPSGHSQE